MQKLVVVAAGGVFAVLAAAGLFLLTPEPPPAPEPAPSRVERPTAPIRPSPAPAEVAAAPAAPVAPVAPPPAPEPTPAPVEVPADHIPRAPGTPEPLVGLDLETMADDARAALGIPEKWKGGVVVKKVDPRSPAAEVRLEAGDVIVQANTERVLSADDLTRAIGDRDHTMIVAIRRGKPFNVVLHKPFRGQ